MAGRIAIALLFMARITFAAGPVCGSNTPLTLIGIDTTSGTMLLNAPALGPAGPWVIELSGDGSRARLHPDRAQGRFGGSVGPGVIWGSGAGWEVESVLPPCVDGAVEAHAVKVSAASHPTSMGTGRVMEILLSAGVGLQMEGAPGTYRIPWKSSTLLRPEFTPWQTAQEARPVAGTRDTSA